MIDIKTEKGGIMKGLYIENIIAREERLLSRKKEQQRFQKRLEKFNSENKERSLEDEL